MARFVPAWRASRLDPVTALRADFVEFFASGVNLAISDIPVALPADCQQAGASGTHSRLREDGGEQVTVQLHGELASLCGRFFSGEISEEEWALLQIHLAYCNACHQAFLKAYSLTMRLLELDRGQAMSEHKRGTVEVYQEVYEPLKQLGVPAAVWDEVLGEVFHEPFGTLAPPFQELLFELEIGKADYPRPAAISDHDYVRNILKDAIAAFEAKGADHARLMGDDGWYYDKALGVRIKPTGEKST